MNVREAVLKAADHIERNPGEFDFGSPTAPSGAGCGTPGCALGWVSTFCGLGSAGNGLLGWRGYTGALPALGLGSYQSFYDRMDGSQKWWERFLLISWRRSAKVCAATLRAYADKYHPAAIVAQIERPTTPPTTTHKYDFNGLADRLAREPRGREAVAA